MQTEHCISHHRSLVRAQMPSYTGSPTLFCLLTRDPLNPLDTSANAQPYNSKNSKTTHYVSNIRSVTTTLERTVWQEKMDFLSQQTLHELYNLWTANNFVTTSLSKVLNLEENWIYIHCSVFLLVQNLFFGQRTSKSTQPIHSFLSCRTRHGANPFKGQLKEHTYLSLRANVYSKRGGAVLCWKKHTFKDKTLKTQVYLDTIPRKTRRHCYL